MTRANPLVGTVTSFKEAFPEVHTVRVTARHEGDASSEPRKSQAYSEQNLPGTIPCVNPRCQQGGYDLMATLIAQTNARQPSHQVTWNCNGHEGSPKGRRRGHSCSNYVEIDFRLTYRP